MRPRPSVPHLVHRMPPGLFYQSDFVNSRARNELLDWIQKLHPIWENRFSENNPPPPGQQQRRLLRPVYWLGNWQFACLDYYHPPAGIKNRCVRAEPFPPRLSAQVAKMETIARRLFKGKDMPPGWHLNTCLINMYGRRREGEKWVDTARVGEHKDFEPGPVASLSFGERAIFQFVASRRPGSRDAVVYQQWLDDGSLQIFGGERWKKHLFHRVQRVDRRAGHLFSFPVDDFETRRINLTFRYVPDEHIIRFSELPQTLQSDVRGYMEQLSSYSNYYKRELSLETVS
jgi:DNA oxidative demethylase